MNLEHVNFGQSYRLSNLAIRLRTFTARELFALTGIVENTVYGFLAKLTEPGYLTWEELPRSTRGRPVKRYTLTEEGLNVLLRKNARLTTLLREEEFEAVGTEAVPAAAAAASVGVGAGKVAADAQAYDRRMAELYREIILKQKTAASAESAEALPEASEAEVKWEPPRKNYVNEA